MQPIFTDIANDTPSVERSLCAVVSTHWLAPTYSHRDSRTRHHSQQAASPLAQSPLTHGCCPHRLTSGIGSSAATRACRGAASEIGSARSLTAAHPPLPLLLLYHHHHSASTTTTTTTTHRHRAVLRPSHRSRSRSLAVRLGPAVVRGGRQRGTGPDTVVTRSLGDWDASRGLTQARLDRRSACLEPSRSPLGAFL